MIRCTIAVLIAATTIAHAQAPDANTQTKADASYAEARRLYAAGNFVGAAEKFTVAYELDHDPGTLFNIAQADRFGKACAKAKDYYQKFLAIVAQPPNRSAIDQYIIDMDTCTEQDQPVAKSTLPEHRVAATPSAPVPRHQGNSHGKLAIGLWIAGGVALGVGAIATAAELSAQTAQHTFVGLCVSPTPCSGETLKTFDDEARNRQHLAQAGYVLGGAAVITGVVFYMLGRHSDEVTIAPTPNGGVVSTHFAF